MKKTTFLTIFFFSIIVSSQKKCNCLANLKWAIKTFEENDSGFQYIIDVKGQDLYKEYNYQFFDKSKGITSLELCSNLINEWLSFFRKGHKSFQIANQTLNQSNTHKTESYINIKLSEFKKYLTEKRNIDYEGIWESTSYTVAIKKIDNIYKGIIISDVNENWNKGEVKFYINTDFSGVYYMGDHSEYSFKKAQFFEKQILNMDGIYFKKIYPENKINNTDVKRYFDLINASTPNGFKINKETYLLRIPSFDLSYKEIIDNLIYKYINDINLSKNLIIDLRGNTGGANKSFEKLLPIIYTNPIRTIYWEHLSTVLNNKRWQRWLENPNLTEDNKSYLTKINNKLKNNLGKFVYI